MVTASNASRQFAKLLRRVASGMEVVVTMRGKPIVKIVPIRDDEERRRRARRRLFVKIDKQPYLNKTFDWTREDIYERDF
jgi:prevent-host-death family protein